MLCTLNVFAATQSECLNGNFTACRELFNKYGSQSDRAGAVELFEKACSAQTLHVSCEIISFSKSDSLKKTLELAKPNSGIFVMNGSKVDKFYQISEVKQVQSYWIQDDFVNLNEPFSQIEILKSKKSTALTKSSAVYICKKWFCPEL